VAAHFLLPTHQRSPECVPYRRMCANAERLRVMTEVLAIRESTIVPCPTVACKLRHIIAGHVVEVLIEDAGRFNKGLRLDSGQEQGIDR
jgi:hypothetical protein